MSALPRKLLVLVVLLTLFAALHVFAMAIVAQEATSTPESATTGDSRTVCDSTTILLLLLAQRDYGFQSDTLDLASFEFGQFQSEFGAAQANEGDGDQTATEEAGMSATEETEVATTEVTPQAGSLITLISAIITGENPQCTLLRTEVEEYLWEQIQAGNTGGGKNAGD